MIYVWWIWFRWDLELVPGRFCVQREKKQPEDGLSPAMVSWQNHFNAVVAARGSKVEASDRIGVGDRGERNLLLLLVPAFSTFFPGTHILRSCSPSPLNVTPSRFFFLSLSLSTPPLLLPREERRPNGVRERKGVVWCRPSGHAQVYSSVQEYNDI